MQVLRKLLLLAFFAASTYLLHAQTRTISGRVVAASNNAAITSASITVKGRSASAIAGDDGSFSITAPAGNVTLVITSVGYARKEVDVPAGQNAGTISLDENGQLGNVVVTALGITRQAKSLVYATQTVKPSELTEIRDANNVINSLSGKVANATISQGSGGPGSGARIVLRGNRSIQGSNNALIVVDGVPIDNTTTSTAGSDFGFVQSSDGASNINPDDIESVTVLRGASAAALYGSQAGNGVIVITTKKGSKDRLSVTINSGVTRESAWSLPRVQNSYGQGNGGKLDATSGESWGARMDGQSFTNFLGQQASYSAQPNNIRDFFRTGTSFNNSIGISGGGEKMQTYLSYTNNSIQGIVPKNDLMRHTVNLRITNQIGKRFSTDAKVTYVNQTINDRPRSGEENAPVIDLYQIPRNIPLDVAKQYATPDNLGIDKPTSFPSTLSSIYQNPYWTLNKTSINEYRDRVIGFLNAKFKITDWLNISGRANLDRTFDRGESSVAQYTILWGRPGGDFSKYNLLLTNKWFDAMLEGNNNLARDLKVNYRVGAIYQDNQYDRNDQGAGGLNITNKYSLNFASNPSVSSGFSEVQTQSVFGQVNLSLKDAIFLDASLRNDWDSRLPSPHTYQYPSVGLSAVISDLITMPRSIPFLKANINYAQVGNGGRFGLLNSVYYYDQGAGNGFLYRSSTYPIPNLKPEIVKSLEFGIETRFLNNRLGLTATYYKSNSYNQLIQISLPVATGYSSKYINVGNIQNQGLELLLSGTPVRQKNLSWDVAFNFSLNNNKIVALDPNIKITTLGGGYGRSATPVVQEGGSYGDLLAIKWATDGKGNRMVDASGKPVLTPDQQPIGNFNPKEILGLTNTLNYKQFSLRVLLDGRIGGVIVSGTEMNLAFSGIPEGTERFREGGLSLGGVDASGNPVSKTITAQDFWQIASGKRYGAGEFFAYDATNFRVREASLGYALPVPKSNVIKGARLSVVARNLFWLFRGSSKLDIPGLGRRKMWFDPDMSLGNGNFQGVEYGTLPSTRSVGLNLQLTF